MVGALDMTNENDRRDLRRSAKRRWNVSERLRDDAIRALRKALAWAEKRRDARAVRGIIRTLATLEGQNQIDEIKTKSRLLFGDTPPAPPAPSVNVNVGVGVVVDPNLRERLLADPEAMRKMLELRRMLYPGAAAPKQAQPALPEPLPQPIQNGHVNGHANGHQNGHRNGTGH